MAQSATAAAATRRALLAAIVQGEHESLHDGDEVNMMLMIMMVKMIKVTMMMTTRIKLL